MGKLNYKESFVAFIDLLGFSQADFDDEGLSTDLLKLLAAIVASKSEFDVSTESYGATGSLKLQAAVSAFSDHVVISYELDRMYADDGLDDGTVPWILVNHLNSMISQVAFAAFRLGFLIRGGVTVGKLHHADGVVFGPGLIEAYRLESQAAVYPRVILSPSVLKRFPKIDGGFVLTDFDGVRHLNYFHGMVMQARGGTINWIADVRAWVDEAVAYINSQISRLNEKDDIRCAAKWTWFLNSLMAAVDQLPNNILREHGVSDGVIDRLMKS